MVVTTPSARPYVPWYQRWDLPALVPGVMFAALMVWSVAQSVAIANWAEGLGILALVALPGLLVGVLFARLTWLPAWLAHTLSAALGVAWAIQRIGPLLVSEIARDMGRPLAERLNDWGSYASEVLIRIIVWGRIIQSGGRGEDIVLFIVALALLFWALGYATAWLLFRADATWPAVVLNAAVILVNYTFMFPKATDLFFVFLATALLLIVHQQIVQKQRIWQAALMDYPQFMPARFLLAATLFCGAVVLVTSILPGNVSSTQAARAWRLMSSPLTAMRESWEVAFSTINAPPGTGGGGFATRAIRVGGGRSFGDAIVMRVRSSKYDYWRAIARDRYTGGGWETTVGERARSALRTTTAEQARTPIETGVNLPQFASSESNLVTQTFELALERNDNLVMYGGQLARPGLPVLVQNGFLTGSSGQPLPNFEETAAVFAQTPLQAQQSYTVTSYIGAADLQSLRAAGTDYPAWVRDHYLQLPDTITERTRAKAREIVQQAGAATPYDQADAIQNYLRRFTYDETRPAPPRDREWVDYFMFDAQKGYCDDFATAMVVMLRSLGVPSRIAQGYAGGTLDPQTGLYVVRETVAHTWPEVYFPGLGWQRFEPTPASYANVPVRPALPDASAQSPDLGGVPAVSRPVRNPDLEELEQRLSRSEEELEASRRAAQEREQAELRRQQLVGAGVFAALLAALGLFLFGLRREIAGLPPGTAAYLRLNRLAAWVGIPQAQHMTPHEYATELGQALPAHRPAINRIAESYVAERYNPQAARPAADLEQDWRAVRQGLLGWLLNRLTSFWRKEPGKKRKK
ncbi:MAG: transglutaminaseTgpA domain-containing protein [Roseiflexaceae bacterium]